MKPNNHPFRTAALLLVMLAAACTKEDDFATPPDVGTANAAPLTITVTDGAYAPTETPDNGNTPDTRAVERGYATEFTKGDQIGLYVVEMEDASNPNNSNRTFLHENLCLTHDGAGWTLPADTKLTHQPPKDGEILYFAYYPYQEDMAGKVDINDLNLNGQGIEAQRFFFRLIDRWQPAADQSTYEAYTASDLMVARGEVAKRTDGTDGSVLSFMMEHQMPLAVFRLPTTKYTYSETIDGKPTEKSYRLYSGLDAKAWLADDNTYRRIMKWYLTSSIGITASYYNSSLERRSFSGTIKPNSSGKYFLFTVDGGEETEVDRSLREGDFYMKDGGIIPQEMIKGDMPAEVQADCLGVVFWVGENEGIHWTQTGWKKGDRLLMRDHPGCVHGIVVALRDASAGAVWAEGSGANEKLYNWAESFQGFNAEEQADWLEIKSSASNHGYCESHLVKLYGTHHPDATFPAYNTIGDYATRHPAPGSSSGWYFPSRSELTMMCYGLADNYDTGSSKERRDLLNGLFRKAGGDVLDGSYWSIWQAGNYSWYFDFGGNTNYGVDPRSETYKVRAVLAF